MIKILVVDDSAFMRRLLSDFLNEHDELSVIATARNGKDALNKLKIYEPDVLTLDIEMPEMNGLETLREMNKVRRIPAIIVSSTTQEGAENTIAALELGAVDFVTKPSGGISLDLHKVKDELIRKVIAAFRANIRSVENNDNQTSIPVNEYQPHKKDKKVVCIGTSTGGPRSLQEVLIRLPQDFPAPVLIVQHMPPKFTASLAKRLDELCSISVKEAVDGEIIKNGTAYIAPGDYHMTAKQIHDVATIHLDQSAPLGGHRPSVNVMFYSVAQLKGYFKIPVILTGMGSDGAEGLKVIKKNGTAASIAESEQSAVIYGMPRVAAQTNHVDHVLHLKEIGDKISNCVQR